MIGKRARTHTHKIKDARFTRANISQIKTPPTPKKNELRLSLCVFVVELVVFLRKTLHKQQSLYRSFLCIIIKIRYRYFLTQLMVLLFVGAFALLFAHYHVLENLHYTHKEK